MSTPFIVAGATPEGQSHWAPIWTNEFFTGLWTIRNPLRDAAVPYLYGKFYGASRYESIWDGVNMEITPKLTLARAPGHSVYNSHTFPAALDFAEFHVAGANTADSIQVLMDTASAVFRIDGNQNITIMSKSTGAGQTRFLQVGNIMYMGNGVDLKQLVASGYVWQSGFTMPQGAYIVDTNNNLQLALGYKTNVSATAVSGNILTVTIASNTNFVVGNIVTLEGLVTSTFLNGLPLVITSVSAGSFTASFNHADYTTASEASGFAVLSGVNGVLGGLQPSWNTNSQGLTADNTNLWINFGPSLRPWGIQTPTAAPNVSNVALPNPQNVWTASTYYMPSPYIVHGGFIFQLTTAGTTGGSVPTFNTTTGATTADGSAVWTSKGTGTRATNTAYAVGALIAVTWTKSVVINSGGGTSGGTGGRRISLDGADTFSPPIVVTYSYNSVFQATTGGTSSSTATASIPWSPGLGDLVNDGGVIWKNVGIEVDRSTTSAAPSFSGTTQSSGTIGNSQLVAINSFVIDANGFAQNVTSAGNSGSTIPTWATSGSPAVESAGLVTKDNQVQWTNGGTATTSGSGGAANTLPWKYGFSFADAITGYVGPMSDLSSAIILAANSYVGVSGVGSSDVHINTINIYRTELGQSVPFLIAQIPNPVGGGAWSYADFSPDFGDPGSTMNNLIQGDTTLQNAPPPAGFLPMAFHLNAIFGFVGDILYYNFGPQVNQIGGYEAFPPLNFVQFSAKGVACESTNFGLYAYLADRIELLGGSAAPFAPTKVSDIGLLSPNALSLNGTSPFVLTSDLQVATGDPTAGFNTIGFPIGDKIAALSPVTSYVAWHNAGTDSRLFVSDGSTGYYNAILTPAPESGAVVWSTKRNIVGGCSAIKSVETSPGNHTLLVGPPSGTGPVLKRDLTTWQDNGQSYACNVILGANVLAHPGQIAEMGFIAYDSVKTGTAPTVSVLLNEISGFSGAPSFDSLTTVEPDPPKLAASSTLYSNRAYFTQTGHPAWCRFFMLQFSFPSENFGAELLSSTIYGAIRHERSNK